MRGFSWWATACDNEGHIDTRMQRCSSCFVDFSVPAQTASVLTTQPRYEISLCSRRWLDITNHHGDCKDKRIYGQNWHFSSRTDFQQPPMLVLGTLSLYWDCTVLFMHGHNNTTTYSSSSQGSETYKELSNQVCTPPTATLGFFCLQQGPAFVRAGSLISTLMTSFRKEAETM